MGEGIYLVGVDADSNGAFCKLCKKFGRPLERTGGVWMTRPFTNWKKSSRKNELMHKLKCIARPGKML